MQAPGGPWDGSTELVHALLANDLVDAMSIFTVPVVLGGGKKLFADGSAPHRYNLTRSRISSTKTPVGLAGAIFGAWMLSPPAATRVTKAPRITKDEADSIPDGLKPPKRERPVTAIIGINDATETGAAYGSPTSPSARRGRENQVVSAAIYQRILP